MYCGIDAFSLRHVDPSIVRPIRHLQLRSPHYHDHVDSFQAPKLRQLPRAPYYNPKRKPTPEGSLGRSPKRRGRVLAKPYLIRRHLELHSGCEGSETLATSCKHKFGRVLSRPMIEIQRCGCRQSCLLLARQRNRLRTRSSPTISSTTDNSISD